MADNEGPFCGMRDRDYFGNGKRDVCKNSERNSELLKVAGFTMINERDTGQERKKRRDTGIRPGYFY